MAELHIPQCQNENEPTGVWNTELLPRGGSHDDHMTITRLVALPFLNRVHHMHGRNT